MVVSMTGFARRSFETTWGSLLWEFKTVNHRYLEIGLRLPEGFKEIEPVVRQAIQQHIKRGKVEVTFKFTQGHELTSELMLNQPLLKQLAGASTVLSQLFPDSVINQADLLQWPGVLTIKEMDKEQIIQTAEQLLDETLVELVGSREREGASIGVFLQARLDQVLDCANKIELALPLISEQMRAKIMVRFEELSLSVNRERLEQEMVWVLQKMDVAEELQRLRAHIDEFKRVLQHDSVAGRRLDFLTQELNREANTLSSKSTVSEVTQAAVELKVQIEQIREQVQNIE